MIDLNNIQKYSENNRIEAKKAMGGLPHSIWETYSAFANTMGGVILLGVEEYRDKSLHPVDLPDPEKLVEEFWRILKNPDCCSVNLLTEEDIQIVTRDSTDVIAISVPPAPRHERPVYIGKDPFTGTYRRSGEGDYKCTREEVRDMLWEKDAPSEHLETGIKIIRYLTYCVHAVPEKIRQDLSLPADEADLVLQKLTYADIIVAEEDGPGFRYRLKR